MSKGLVGLFGAKEVGSSENKRIAPYLAPKNSRDFPLPSGDMRLLIPADLVKTHLSPTLFISAAAAATLVQASKESWRCETGSSCHFKTVKTIGCITLNEKLMDFKGNEAAYHGCYTLVKMSTSSAWGTWGRVRVNCALEDFYILNMQAYVFKDKNTKAKAST